MKKLFLFVLCLLIIGCGSEEGSNPVDSSGLTVEINSAEPSLSNISIAVDVTQKVSDSGNAIANITISLKDENGNPMNGVDVDISGSHASSRYFFYTEHDSGGIALDSPFTYSTDAFGVSEFSIQVPALFNGSVNIFSDKITISSGSVSATIGIGFS